MSRTRKRDGRTQLKTQRGWKFVEEAHTPFEKYFGQTRYVKLLKEKRSADK